MLNAATTATAGGALAAATYFYKVTAVSAAGQSAGSNEVSVTTTGTTSTVTLTWSAVAGATGYKVYRSTVSNAEVLIATLGDVLTYIDTGAAAGTDTPPSAATSTSVEAYGKVADFSGVFSEGPLRGSSLIIPGAAGEVHVPKVRAAYDFTVPMVLRSSVGGTGRAEVFASIESLRALLNSAAAPLSLSRAQAGRATQRCTAEYVAGLELELVGFTAARAAIVLRNLSGIWT